MKKLELEIKKAVSSMTEGTDPERVKASVRERIEREDHSMKITNNQAGKRRRIAVLASAAVLIMTTTAAAAK